MTQKVKIKRLRRTKRKEKPLISAKTARTIRKLQERKRMNIQAGDTRISVMGALVQRQRTARKSAVRHQGHHHHGHGHGHNEDPNKAPPDKFESIMTGFHTMSCNKVEALEHTFDNLKIFAGNVAVFFGEHEDMEWEELFKVFLKFLELIAKAQKQNNDLAKKIEKERKKEERERKKKERMAKRGLTPKIKTKEEPEDPTNILEEIKMRSAKGTLSPSEMKGDVVGYEKMKSMEVLNI